MERDAPHSYLVVDTSSVEQGWAVLDAVDQGLAPAERERIRTSAPVGAGPAMFVDWTGECDRDRSFVDAATRIATGKGAKSVRCTATPPG